MIPPNPHDDFWSPKSNVKIKQAKIEQLQLDIRKAQGEHAVATRMSALREHAGFKAFMEEVLRLRNVVADKFKAIESGEANFGRVQGALVAYDSMLLIYRKAETVKKVLEENIERLENERLIVEKLDPLKGM